MTKQVSLPKISLILQKMKIGQNSIYAFLHEALQLYFLVNLKPALFCSSLNKGISFT